MITEFLGAVALVGLSVGERNHSGKVQRMWGQIRTMMIVKNDGDSNPDDNDYCQMNKDRCWSWVRCNICNIFMKQNCLRQTSTFLACWTNRFVTCHFIFSFLSFLVWFFLVGERGLLHVIHLFFSSFFFTTLDKLVCCFPPLEKPGTNLRKWKCSQTCRGKKNFFVAKPVGQNHI